MRRAPDFFLRYVVSLKRRRHTYETPWKICTSRKLHPANGTSLRVSFWQMPWPEQNSAWRSLLPYCRERRKICCSDFSMRRTKSTVPFVLHVASGDESIEQYAIGVGRLQCRRWGGKRFFMFCQKAQYAVSFLCYTPTAVLGSVQGSHSPQ